MGADMRTVTLRRLRLASQIFFFALFVFLLIRTEFPGAIRSAALDVRIPWPVGWFLDADPLVALATALSTGTLYRNLLWAVPFLLLAILVGRAFCGWMCPLGSLHHFVSSLKSDAKRGAKLIESNRYKRWQAAKYHLLAAVLVMALFGSVAGLLLDPLVVPRAVDVGGGAAGVQRGHPRRPRHRLRLAARPAQAVVNGAGVVLNATVLSFKQPHFNGAFLIGTLFVFVLVLNSTRHALLVPRDLPARRAARRLLALVAGPDAQARGEVRRLPPLPAALPGRRRPGARGGLAQGGMPPLPELPQRLPDRRHQLRLVDAPSPAKQTRETPELKRRALFTSMAAGAVMVPLMRSGPGLKTPAGTFLIRPPGSLDESHFLDRCIRCGDCMKVCPNNALHPATLEGGVEGLWTPVLVPRIGYCEPNCVLCSQVCPTGAIWEITVAEKTGTRMTRRSRPRDRRRRRGQRARLATRRSASTRAEGSDPHRHGVLRSRAVPPLGDGHRVHRLRGVVPDVAEGHLPRARRGGGPERRDQDAQAAVRRPEALHRLRRVRGTPARSRAARRSTSPARARPARRPTSSC